MHLSNQSLCYICEINLPNAFPCLVIRWPMRESRDPKTYKSRDMDGKSIFFLSVDEQKQIFSPHVGHRRVATWPAATRPC
jgi:hypothetical protein